MGRRKQQISNENSNDNSRDKNPSNCNNINNKCNNVKTIRILQKIWIDSSGLKSNRIALIFVAITSFITRFYDLHEPAHVCWDETHFGKMASWYINRTFFFDVHPPLGKMLIAYSGYISGYDGRFAFDKPGDPYEHWTQYLGMRIFCAALGMTIPSFIYLATKSMTKSTHSAIIAALLIVFDNGMITLTRYILLDPPLLFFVSAAILGMAKFSFSYGPSSTARPFSKYWWFWLIWTGVSISCAFSVKFVGLFIVALVGLRTAYDIWIILGDVSRPISYFLKHFLARVLCLIALPICIYVFLFYVHLKQLDHTGNGDGFYSSSFQSQLIGNSLYNSSWPAHLAYGAEVTIKNNRIGGAYLHSHWHLYPEGVGARQQQVTTYSHKDSNNKWLIKRGLVDQRLDDIFVRDGDLIRLEHVVTKRNLHSHFEIAPLTKRHYQVTGYGENGLGDANDLWQISKDSTGVTSIKEDNRIYTVRTRFKLIHYLTNCALHSHSKQLPKWAYEQLEVTCNPKIHDKNNYWNIEDNFYPHLPNVSFEEYAPSFLDRFVESHAVMLQGNAGLKPKEGEVTSRPWQWPINYRGQFFSASKGQKIYLLGNPIIWWANIITIPLASILILVLVILNKAGKSSNVSKTETNLYSSDQILSTYLEASVWILIGWLLHYVPFYFMGRVLYFHHYFPAFMFSCMQTSITYDYLITYLCKNLSLLRGTTNFRRAEFSCILISIVIYTFTKFIPLTYGTKSEFADSNQNSTIESWRSEQQLSTLKWLDSWEF